MAEKLAMTTILTGESLEAHADLTARLPYGKSMGDLVRDLLIDENERQEKAAQ